jgi:hypothetical protein
VRINGAFIRSQKRSTPLWGTSLTLCRGGCRAKKGEWRKPRSAQSATVHAGPERPAELAAINSSEGRGRVVAGRRQPASALLGRLTQPRLVVERQAHRQPPCLQLQLAPRRPAAQVGLEVRQHQWICMPHPPAITS